MLFQDQQKLFKWGDLFTTQQWIVVNSDKEHQDKRLIDVGIPIIEHAVDPNDELKCPVRLWTDAHIIIKLVHGRTADIVLVELFAEHIQIHNFNYQDAPKSYRGWGLPFIHRRDCMNLNKSYRPAAILVDPTISELRDVDLLMNMLRTGTPNQLCTAQKKVRGADPYYYPDYAGILKKVG